MRSSHLVTTMEGRPPRASALVRRATFAGMRLVPSAYRVVLVAAALALLGTATYAGDTDDVGQQLDALWQARTSGSELEAALDRARAVMADDANNFDVAWRLARAIRW